MSVQITPKEEQVTYKIGLLGAGGHGRRHVEAGLTTGLFSLAAAFDPSYASVVTLHQLPGAGEPTRCESAEALVNHPDVDVVVIASLDALHPGQLELAARAGKPVLCDKPLAITWDGLKIVKQALVAAREAGIATATCLPRFEDPPYQWVKANLAMLMDRYGRLVHVTLDSSYPAPRAAWKYQRSLLQDHFIHELSVLLWWLGDRSFTVRREVNEHDAYCVTGKMEALPGEHGHSIGLTCMVTRLEEIGSKEFPETIMLRFAHGACTVNTLTGEVQHGLNRQRTPFELAATAPTDHDGRLARVMVRFADAIASRTGIPDSVVLLTDASIALERIGVSSQTLHSA